MAIIYGKNTAVDYAAGNLASFGKSYSRMGAAPLDMTEVWYDKAALEEYAAYRGVEQADGSYDTSSVTSYVGQRVVFVDETANKVYNYSIQLDGSLKEIGTSPVGDNKSIAVAADGTVSLKGIDGLVFEREVDVLDENGEPTGEKKTEEVKYQPLMTKAGLTWVEPSKTTVEGLALLIEALSADVKALETKVGKAAEGEDAATGLFKAIADEAKARDDADKALDAKIGAASVPETTEGAGDGKAATGVYVAIEAEAARAKAAEEALGQRITNLGDVVTEEELTEAIKDFATKKYVDDEIEAIEETISKLNHFTTKIVADVSEVTEEGILYLIKDTEATGADVYNEYLYVGGQAVLIGDTTTDLSDYYTKDDTDTKFADYTTTADLETLLAGKQDNIPEGTYATPADVQGAKDYADGLASNYDEAGAAEDVKDYADETFATKAYVGTIPEGKGSDIIAYVNKKAEETLAAAQGGSSETAASVKLALDNYKTENEPKFAKLEGIEAGAEVNVIKTVKVNGTALGVTDKAVDIDLSAYAKQADLNTVSDTANKGVADAAAAQGTANAAAQAAGENAANITGLDTRLGTAEGKINEHTTALATHATEYADLKGRVDGHDTAIAGKAAQADLEALQGVVGGHTTALGTLNTTTIPALQADINSKATGTALTEEINRATAAEQANASAIKAIADDYLKGADKTTLEQAIALKADTTALEAEVERATKKEGELADLIAGNTAVINSILGNEDEVDLNSIAELAAWITEHGKEATAMTEAIEKNAEDIAANTKKIGEVEASIPGALAAALADYKVKDVDGVSLQLSDAGVASVKAVSTDLLVQGELEFILNGGSAN